MPRTKSLIRGWLTSNRGMYVDATTKVIPAWLPWHVAWAYLTGATFVAAGLAVIVGVLPRLAAALSTAQIGLFGVIVWIPRVITGDLTEFQRGEFVVTFVLMAGAWVVTESFRTERSAQRSSKIQNQPQAALDLS